MANYAMFIILMAIGCGLLDLLTDHWPAMQRQLFPVVTIGLYVLCIIAYYYGPDILTYVPYYEEIARPEQLIHNPKLAGSFEFGYAMFCSLMHAMGLSYWGMTAVVKTLYFIALWVLLRRLPKRQIFAMACVVMTDINLIMHENRQCLAVSFFIFMILLIERRQYLLGILFAVITMTMHKSGFIPVGLTVVGIFFYHNRQYATIYTLLILGLLVIITLPVQRISSSLIQYLPLPSSYMASLTHHLSVGLQFQTIAIIYLALLLVFSLYLSYTQPSRYTWITFLVMVGMAVIVLLYPYYFLLIRVRSYFTPFIVYYLIILLSSKEYTSSVPLGNMIKQALMLLVIAFYLHVAISQERGARALHSPVYKACTVFELRHASSKQIRARQFRIARNYWKTDYMRQAKSSL